MEQRKRPVVGNGLGTLLFLSFSTLLWHVSKNILKSSELLTNMLDLLHEIYIENVNVVLNIFLKV